MKKKLFISILFVFSMCFIASSEKCNQKMLVLPEVTAARTTQKVTDTKAEMVGNDVATLLPRFIIIE